MTRREPIRAKSVRVPDALWHAAQATAAKRGEILSEVIRADLERYVRKSRAAEPTNP